MTTVHRLPSVPVKHADFAHYVNSHPDRSIEELIRPYNEFDAVLRKIYAQAPTHPVVGDNYLNIVPVYSSAGVADVKVRARDLASEPEDLKSKYLMPLTSAQRRPHGSPAVVPSLREFQTNFNLFSEGSLLDMDWSNVIAAGSAVVTSLLPVPDKYRNSKRELRKWYREKAAPASDVDLFLYGLTEEQAIEKIKLIEDKVTNATLHKTSTIRTKNTITIVSNYPTRHVQIVLRIYKSIAEILTGFDVDCACAAYDGRQVYLAPRALAAYITQVNQVDLTRRSPSYEARLSKYSHRGFEVFWSQLDRTRIDPVSSSIRLTMLAAKMFLNLTVPCRPYSNEASAGLWASRVCWFLRNFPRLQSGNNISNNDAQSAVDRQPTFIDAVPRRCVQTSRTTGKMKFQSGWRRTRFLTTTLLYEYSPH